MTVTDRPNETATRAQRWLATLAAVLFVAIPVAGCGDNTGSTGTTGTTGGTTTDPLARAQYGGEYAGGVATGDTQAGAAFAQWVLDQDPQRQYITDAVVRGEETLGVKINPTATKAEVQQLLVALTEGMARTFRGKPLRVNAFYQTGEKMAEAVYDNNTNRVQVNFVQ